ncbi:hypothetical protein [Marilutibacter aestuarii]|nr:hypothetical protein [Lysobacter aestuarii]
MNRMIGTLLASACLLMATACNGAPADAEAPPRVDDPARDPPRAMAPSADAFKAFIDEIREFAGMARLAQGAGMDAAAPQALADRIVAGFEQDPPRQLKLQDGRTIYWGWQEGQAFVKSIAIRGADGELQLLGAVDDLPTLYSHRAGRAIADRGAYEAYMRERADRGSEPAIELFAEDADALAEHYPLAKRWMQAAMMGFNADCGNAAQQPSCAFVEQVDLPVDAQALDCVAPAPGRGCSLQVPDVPAADVPLGAFRQ